jgi:transporter family-2 protein
MSSLGPLHALALVAGVGLTIQVGMNATIARAIGGAGAASLVNFLVGTAGLVAFLVATRVGLPARDAMVGLPGWAWLGGLLGAFYVAAATFVGPRIGATALVALVVVGQIVSSVIVDHYGWLGFPREPVTLAKLAGCALLVAGILLVTSGK